VVHKSYCQLLVNRVQERFAGYNSETNLDMSAQAFPNFAKAESFQHDIAQETGRDTHRHELTKMARKLAYTF